MRIMKTKESKLILLISVLLLLSVSFFICVFFSMKLVLIGNEKITLNYSEKYKEPGFKATVLWTDTTKKVKVKSQIKNDIGTYKIIYNYKFMCFYITKSRFVSIVDKEKPNIDLKNGNLIQLHENEVYTEPGYTAIDNKDGDITQNVKIEGNVDTTKVGEYVLKYSVTDSSGNKTEVERKINVIKDTKIQNKKVETSIASVAKKFVIVGDSNVKNMYLNGYVEKGKAWAIPCLHAQSMQSTAVNIYGNNEKMTIVDASRKYQPERLVLYFGTFSTAWISESEFDTNAQSIINQIKSVSPNTSIYLLSLIPITQNGPNINNFSQQTIDYFNTKISVLANSNGLKYLDVQTIFKDQNGYGNSAYYVSDGYHLNSTGHKMLRNYLNLNL